MFLYVGLRVVVYRALFDCTIRSRVRVQEIRGLGVRC